jgi:benzoyl-CoA reductase/2-hydroxyglutaryl-CoA dehydratase subunit BcrC/BadD/HgdB
MDNGKPNSKTLLDQLVAKHYDDAFKVKEAGGLVAWATSISCQELLEVMGIYAVYPENHSAAMGARKTSPGLIEQAESKGYSIDICSYARVNLGYKDIMHSEAGNLPKPDLVFCCNNICTTVQKWYENLAVELDIPFILFDTPFNHTREASEHGVLYMRAQIESIIEQLEEITGRKFDYDKFTEVMRLSNETAHLWRDSCFLAKSIPSPLNGYDMFNYMALAVCMRGRPEGRDLFRLWHDELSERIKNGQGPWKEGEEEKFRIIWDGIACFANLATTYKILKKYGVNVVSSVYPDAWSIFYETNDLEGMARAYSYYHANRNLDVVAEKKCGLAADFSAEGVIFHSNRSCKLMDFTIYEQQRRIESRLGIPCVVIDGDMTDPRAFSEAQYETRVQALVEMMEANKKRRAAQ